MRNIFQTVAIAMGMFAAVAPAHAVVLGTANTETSLGFGGNNGSPYFQQIFSASLFSGAVNINNLTFYNSRYPGGTATPGNFRILLSTTTFNNIGAFDTTISEGAGSPSIYAPAGAVEVFNGNASAPSNGKLVFNLSQAFNYSAAAGTNLVLTIINQNASTTPTLFLDAQSNANPTMNYRTPSFAYNYNTGLVTGINEATAPVPEPATWAMMLVGFGVVGGAMRSRRVTVSFA